MPKAKKATAPKAVAKKQVPAKKKEAPKKAAAKPVEPVKKFDPVHVYLHTNGGEHHLSFSDEAMFKAAMQCIEGAPKQSTGARTNPTYLIQSDDGPLAFQFVRRYSIKS